MQPGNDSGRAGKLQWLCERTTASPASAHLGSPTSTASSARTRSTSSLTEGSGL